MITRNFNSFLFIGTIAQDQDGQNSARNEPVAGRASRDCDTCIQTSPAAYVHFLRRATWYCASIRSSTTLLRRRGCICAGSPVHSSSLFSFFDPCCAWWHGFLLRNPVRRARQLYNPPSLSLPFRAGFHFPSLPLSLPPFLLTAHCCGRWIS
jgi:hypothetical protein